MRINDKKNQWKIHQQVVNKLFRMDLEFRTKIKPSKKLYKRSKSKLSDRELDKAEEGVDRHLDSIYYY